MKGPKTRDTKPSTHLYDKVRTRVQVSVDYLLSIFKPIYTKLVEIDESLAVILTRHEDKYQQHKEDVLRMAWDARHRRPDFTKPYFGKFNDIDELTITIQIYATRLASQIVSTLLEIIHHSKENTNYHVRYKKTY